MQRVKEYFLDIRNPGEKKPLSKYVADTLIILILGLLFGLFSRILDFIPDEALPEFLSKVDFAAYFSRLSVWLLLALIISVVSNTPIRAMINVPIFFLGMLCSYYAYTYIMESHVVMRIVKFWLVLTCVSPFLAFLCWYAKGKGFIPMIITSVIWSVLFLLSVDIRPGIVEIKYYGLELINFILSLFLLKNNKNQSINSFILFLGIVIFSITFENIFNLFDKFYFL